MYSQNRLNLNRIPDSFPRSAYSTCRVGGVCLGVGGVVLVVCVCVCVGVGRVVLCRCVCV